MKKIKAFISSKWFIHGLGLLTLSVLIWFLGPLIAIADNYFLEPIANRIICIGIILFIYAGNELRKYLMAKRKNQALINELGSDETNALSEESEVIQERFQEAVEMLKMSSKSRKKGYLYELPWYIIIGPPGSGKTTALLNSGLEFPLEDKIGLESVKGIGGTRHCDWWFTSDAVLIDTAGRFTTQDSQEDVDKTAWHSFMSLLKKFRKQRPINGALIAVSITDLLTLSENERLSYAKTIRKRIEELNKELNIEFPIYFMFTKCDLIAGFNEYFDNCSEEERSQVWGYTLDFPANGKLEFVPQELEAELEQLTLRLKGRMLEKVANTRDRTHKASILNFASQFEALKVPIVEFVNDIFSANRFQSSTLLRGVYFTSGTQQGTPFDQLLGNMSRSMGLSESDSNLVMSGKGKSFFLRGLLSDVIFPESEIAGVDQRFRKLMKRLSILGYAAASILLLSAVGLWYLAYIDQNEKILQVENTVNQYEEQKLKSERIIGADFSRILDELNTAKASTDIFRAEAGTPTLGLSEASTFNEQTDDLYTQALQNTFLPLVTARLEEILIDIINQGDTTLLYDVLKAYLMYAGEHEDAEAQYEPDWLLALSQADWNAEFALSPTIVQQLHEHHKALINSGYSFITPDKTIVSAARDSLKKLPVSEQVYQNVKQSLTQDRSMDLYFRDITGNFGIDVFKSRSGADLKAKYISGLFTKEGFYKAFIPKSSEKANDYIVNNWVLGQHNNRSADLTIEDLKEDLYLHYYQDYVQQWQGLLRDLTFIEPDNFRQGVSIIEQAAGINGPLENLINTVSSETMLTSPLSGSVDTQAVSENLAVVSGTAQRIASQANRVARATQKAGISAMPGEFVEEQFAVYHRLVSTERGEAAINRILIDARNFSLFVNQVMFDGFSNTAAFDAVQNRINRVGRDPFSSLLSSNSLMSPELRSMLDTLSGIGWRMFLQKARQEINTMWQQEILVDYDKAIAGRYPFETRTDIEVELRDFSSFFRPDGRLDSFIQQYLQPFINMRSSQWSLKTIDGESLGLSSATVEQLQIANQITELFFSANALTPRITLSLTPKTLDGNVTQFMFALGDQQIVYAHGPRRSRRVAWPLEQGDERATVQFTAVSGQVAVSSKEGPWSLFRLLDDHKLTSTTQNSMFGVDFEVSGYKASYELRADTEFNPIGGRMLQNLRLPREL